MVTNLRGNTGEYGEYGEYGVDCTLTCTNTGTDGTFPNSSPAATKRQTSTAGMESRVPVLAFLARAGRCAISLARHLFSFFPISHFNPNPANFRRNIFAAESRGCGENRQFLLLTRFCTVSTRQHDTQVTHCKQLTGIGQSLRAPQEIAHHEANKRRTPQV